MRELLPWLLVFGVIGAVFLGVGRGTTTAASEAAHAAVAERGARIVDVRTPEEFAAGHVEGAVNIPVGELGSRLAELGPSTTPVVVYCQSGARSAAAAATLEQRGFEDVTDLGAMRNW